MIQYIESQTIGNTKITLWRVADYSYQIEISNNGQKKVLNFAGEYHEAMSEFILKASEINKMA